MNYTDLKNNVMFQTNNDIEDVEEFNIALPHYINEGYGMLTYAFWKIYPSTGGLLLPLTTGTDVPNLPLYAHRAVADYATYLVYRNGNPVKQNRGERYLRDFQDILTRLKEDGSKIENGGLNADGTLMNAEDAINRKKKTKLCNIYPPYI